MRAGEFELIKQIDYRDFNTEELYSVYKRVLCYIDNELDHNRRYYAEISERIDWCAGYVLDQLSKIDASWDLTNYTVYTSCYSDDDCNCIHKVFNKTTQCYTAFSGRDIKRLMDKENLSYRHFNRW